MSAQRSRTCASVSTFFGSGELLVGTKTLPMFGLCSASGAVTRASFRTFTRNSRVPPCTSCGRRRRLLHPHPALGADVHRDQDARIEDLLDAGDRRGLVFQSNRGVQRVAFGIRQRLAEIPQRGLEPACLLCQRLQRHGRGRSHGCLLIGTKRAPERNRGGEQEERLSDCAAHARVVSRVGWNVTETPTREKGEGRREKGEGEGSSRNSTTRAGSNPEPRNRGDG